MKLVTKKWKGDYCMKNLGKLTMAAVIATSAVTATTAQAATIKTTTKYANLEKGAKLNIRASASTKSKVVGQYQLNDEVKVIKSYSKNWYQVLYKGKKRYVSKTYVKNVPVVVGIGYANTSKGVNLNVRASKSTKAKAIGKYKNNQEIYITNSYVNWYQVLYKGKVGYVSSKYVDGEHDFT